MSDDLISCLYISLIIYLYICVVFYITLPQLSDDSVQLIDHQCLTCIYIIPYILYYEIHHLASIPPQSSDDFFILMSLITVSQILKPFYQNLCADIFRIYQPESVFHKVGCSCRWWGAGVPQGSSSLVHAGDEQPVFLKVGCSCRWWGTGVPQGGVFMQVMSNRCSTRWGVHASFHEVSRVIMSDI